MRISVQLQVVGKTAEELMKDATKKWQNFIEDKTAQLPYDSEIDAKTNIGDEFTGTVYIRYKVEETHD